MQQKVRRLFMNRQFVCFLISQNLISCGAIIQVVAIARFIVDMTSSGIITGFSIVCAPLPGILLSLFAGSIGDRFQAKRLLVFFDILRGCLIMLFIFCKTSISTFSVMILISTLDVLYSPSKNKVLASIVGSENLLDSNSLLSGGYGAISMVMPIIIGLLIGSFGVKTAFIIGSLMYFLSSILLSGVKMNGSHDEFMENNRFSNMSEGIRYCLRRPPLKRAILTTAFADFGTICVNIIFYSLVFDTIKASSGYWGLLLSVLYGMNLFSMLIIMNNRKLFTENPLMISQFLLIAVSLAWCFYSFTRNPIYILIGVAAEGLSMSTCNTLLMTCILENARKEYTARIVGIKDLASNAAKLIGIGFTYFLMRFFDVNVIFILCAAIVFLYAAAQIVSICQTKLDKRKSP